MNKYLIKIFVFLLNLVSKTWRFEFNGTLLNEPCIVILWHRYLLAGWKFLSKQGKFYAVVSPSRDGEYLVKLLSKWNLSFIRGSSDKNSNQTMNDITNIASTNCVSLTPDGPRGPLFKLKPGAVVAAHRAGVPLQFLKIYTTNKLIFNKSWDKFELPLPFTKINIHISNPIVIPRTATREKINDFIYQIQELMQND